MGKNEVDNIYFTPSMDTVIAETLNGKTDDIADDYSSTQITPYVSNYVLEAAMKKNVRPVFLQPLQPGFIESAIATTVQGINTFFIPFILVTTLISAFRGRNMNNPNSMMPGGGINSRPSFFGIGGKNDFEKDVFMAINFYRKYPKNIKSFA